ncbi:nucleotidyltransferase domain-containing protein [Virgibacillus sp. W0430]|uniref:nucleotidyltransferase domain-containing protein n=1 Tax=Virgibacillus sp. W0430 TaxID=3391580 RepID=UPI003F4897D5
MKKMFNRLNMERVPKEVKYILALLGERAYDEKLLETVDWSLFLHQAKHHRVFPLLYPRIKEKNHIPNEIKRSMKQLYENNTFQMLFTCAELVRVNRLFAEQHIRVLFMKGPVMAQQLYGEISNRTSSDIDVLIPMKQIDVADRVLSANGYKKNDYIDTVLGDWKWRHHHVTYFHERKKLKIEVHWRLNPGPASEPSFAELWKTKCAVKLTGSPVYTLNKEYLFLFLVEHGARHGWSRLRWIYDIKQLIEQNPDWKTISRLLNKYGAKKVGGQALYLVHAFFPQTSKSAHAFTIHRRSKQLAQSAIFYLETMINLHNEPLPEQVSAYHASYLFGNMSFKQRTLFIMSFLYPYAEDKETLALPKSFHFLYFGLRPFLVLWRKWKKGGEAEGANSA